MTEYEAKTKAFLIGKTIKDVQIDGYCFVLKFTDNSRIEYYASDGGYSSWSIQEAKGATK
jgi:hypothetical protein